MRTIGISCVYDDDVLGKLGKTISDKKKKMRADPTK